MLKIRRLRRTGSVPSLIVLLFVAACGGSDEAGPSQRAVGSIALDRTSSTIAVGTSTTLVPTVTDVDGAVITDPSITWTSGAAATASVSGLGVVTGVGAGGPVTITAASGGKNATAQVTVVAAGPNLAGTWSHNRTGGNFQPNLQGTIVLARKTSCDGDGFVCYSGVPVVPGSTATQTEWLFGVLGTQVLVCLGDGCGFLDCLGTITNAGRNISGSCYLLTNTFVGTFTATKTS